VCLAIPGEIIELLDGGALPTGKVSFAGVVKDVCLVYVPEAGLGDHVLVHAGFAIAQIDEQQARETLACLARLAPEPESEPEPEPELS